MKLVVKPRQAFFATPVGQRGPPTPPASWPTAAASLPSSPQHSFPAAARPSQLLGECGGGKRMLLPSADTLLTRCRVAANLLVGWRVCRSGRQARTTVYPWGAGHGPQHLLPYTPRASGTPPARVHPSNERCLPRNTRRHSGGSFRPPLFPPAAAAPSLLPFSALSTHESSRASHRAAAARACRRAVESTRRRQSFSWAPSGNSPCST